MEITLLPAAQEYKARGWSVIPLRKNSKRPAIEHWKPYQTRLATDEEIEGWFAEDQHNIGLVTGKLSGLAVLDIDTWQTTQGLEFAKKAGLPPTLVVKTPNGRQDYYAYPDEEVRNFARKVPGLDFRGEGGYVVAPPSHVEASAEEKAKGKVSGDYVVTLDAPLAAMPVWVQHLTKSKAEVSVPTGQGIAVGARNDTLTKMAGKLRRLGLNEAEILGALMGANKTRCNPPLKIEELRTIAHSVASYKPEETVELASWTLSGASDIMEPMAPTVYVVDGLLPAQSLSIIYGAPGTLKTMLLIDMAIAVASGQRWLTEREGSGGRETKQVPVLVCDFDSGRRPVKQRLHAAMRARGLGLDLPIFYVSMPEPWLDASMPDSMAVLERAVEDCRAGLVIVECLRSISGSVEENSAEMGTIVSNFRRLSERAACAVTLSHHQRKGETNGRAGDALRGHSSIEAGLDLALLVKREDDSETISLKATKVREAPVKEFGAEFEYTQLVDSRDLYSMMFYAAEPENPKKTNEEVRECVMRIVADEEGINATALDKSVANELEVSRTQARKARQALVKNGQIEVQPGHHRAQEHYLADLPI